LGLEDALIVVVHVGFIDDGQPFVLPMIGKMGQYDNNPMAMYIHGIPPSDKSNSRLRLWPSNASHEKQK